MTTATLTKSPKRCGNRHLGRLADKSGWCDSNARPLDPQAGAPPRATDATAKTSEPCTPVHAPQRGQRSDRLEQFFERLRRTPRRWTVGENSSGQGIRLPVPGELDRCPLTAVCGGDGILVNGEACERFLGLAADECARIMYAADYAGLSPRHRALRARILEACGLTKGGAP